MKAEDNQFPYVTVAEAASSPGAAPAGCVRIWRSSVDGKLYVTDDAGTDLAVGGSGDAGGVATALQTHLDDSADAHDASAISVNPVGSLAATDVQAALAELDAETKVIGPLEAGSTAPPTGTPVGSIVFIKGA